MTKPGRISFAGMGRRDRRALMLTTALQAAGVILLAFPVRAQPAPLARPAGGQVVAGQARIQQSTAQTTVTQGSQRAAVDWRSFDVGSQHTVTYQQPNSSAVILNRVTGPDPSQIAGRISANGQVILVNQSGVVFHQGSQVDAQSLVVSAPGITNRNFMAGRMVFDQAPKPGAQVVNAGTITVGQSGLAALVGPQVTNAGTIRAQMGRVVLAGAEAHVVDLYGDGLMSVDVTRQVRTAPGGGKALVTNTGLVSAEGGSITLTAQAADGIVSNLVHAGGRLQADSLPGRPGTVTIAGVGGSITVAGAIRTNGRDGAAGGTIHLAATDAVTVADGARLSANGAGGGGTIAVGTTPARAQAQGRTTDLFPAGTARTATVAPGARISANGRGTGSGGTVAVLSTHGTTVEGPITATAGRQGGDGGRVELSARQALSVPGRVDVSASKGKGGTILLDPEYVTITEEKKQTLAPGESNMSVAEFNNKTGGDFVVQANIDITTSNTTPLGSGNGPGSATGMYSYGIKFTAGHDIIIGGPINTSAQTPTGVPGEVPGVVFEAGRNITINGQINTSGKPVNLIAGTGLEPGTITVTAPILSGAFTALTTTAGGNISLGAITASGPVTVTTPAALTVNDRVVAAGGSLISLTAQSIKVGDATTQNNGSLAFSPMPNGMFAPGSVVTLRADALALNKPLGNDPAVQAPSGTVNIAPNTPGTLLSLDNVKATGNLSLTQADITRINTGPANNGTLRLGRLGDATAETTAGDIRITDAITLVNTAGTLGLYAKAVSTQTATGTVTGTGTIAETGVGGLIIGTTNIPGTLTGAATGAVTLGTVTAPGAAAAASPNQFSILNNFTAGNDLAISAAPQGAGGLALQGTINARTVRLQADSIAATGEVGAAETVPATGTVFLRATTGGITLSSGTLGAEAAVTLESATGTTVSGGFLNAGRTAQVVNGTAITARDGTIDVTGGLNIKGGEVFANIITVTKAGTATEGLNQSGGKLAANTLTPRNGFTFTNGIAYVRDDLTVSSPGLAATSQLHSGSSITLETTVPDFKSAGTLAAARNVTIKVPGQPTFVGSVTQTGGIIAAGGDLFVTMPGLIAQTAGTMAAGGTLRLSAAGAGDATFAGTLAGSTVTVAEPAATLTYKGTIEGARTFSGTRFEPIYRCGGCDGIGPSIGLTLVPPAPGGGSAGRPRLIRMEGNSLTLGASLAADTIELHSVTDTIQTGGTLTADLLHGTAGYTAPTYTTPGTPGSASLEQPGNAIATLGPYTTLGRFGLVDTAALTVVNRVVAGGGSSIGLTAPSITVGNATTPNNGSLAFGTVTNRAFSATDKANSVVTLRTDALTLNAPLGDGPAVRAPSGTVNIAPNTPGTMLSLDNVKATGNLSLTQADITRISTGGTASNGTLRLGRLGDATAETTAGTTAGDIRITEAITLVNTAGTLGLYAQATGAGTGTIAETGAGGLTIGTTNILGILTGKASGSVTLGTVPATAVAAAAATSLNHFDVLQDFTAGTGLTVSTATTPMQGLDGLVLRGTVDGGPALALLSQGKSIDGTNRPGTYRGGTIALGDATQAATVSGTTVTTVTLATRDGNASAAAITQTAGSTLAAPRLSGSVSTADTGTGYGVSLRTSGDTELGGFTVGRPNPDGRTYAVQGSFALTTAGTLTVDAPTTLPLVAGAVSLQAGSIAVTGEVGAVATGPLPGTVSLTATTGGITLSSGTLGAQAAVSLDAKTGTTVSGGTLDAGRTAQVVNGTAITARDGSIGVTGSMTITGGQVFADAITFAGPVVQSGGALAANTLNLLNGFTFTNGKAYAGNGLAVSSPGLAAGSQLSSGGSITLTTTTSDFKSTGTLIAAADVRIDAIGSVTQTGGTIAAGQDLFVTAPGLIAQTAGIMAARGTLQLYATGTGDATFAGTLAGATVIVVEPAATLTYKGAVRGAATVGGFGFNPTYHCGGCDTLDPSIGITTPVVTTPPKDAGRPGLIRMDGGKLTLATSLDARVIELHSVTDTLQTGGTLTAGLLRGTAGYTATLSPSALPTYTTPGTTGIASLDQPGNAIATLGPYLVRGNDATRDGFRLTNASALTVLDRVQAGQGTGPLTATNLAATGNLVQITLTGSAGNLSIGASGTDAVLAGSTVRLTTSGGITESLGGRVVAGMLTGSATSANLATTTAGTAGGGGNQVGTLLDFTTTAGDLVLVNSRSLQVTNAAASGAVAVTAQNGRGTASADEGQAAGTMGVSGVTGASVSLLSYGDMTGGTVSAAGTASFTAGGSVALSDVGATTLTGQAGNNFAVGGSYATVTAAIADTGALNLADTAAVSLTGPLFGRTGATVSANGIATAADISSYGDIRLQVTGPDNGFVKSAGTVAANGSLYVTGTSDTAGVGREIRQSGGILAAAGEVRLFSAGDAVQTGGTVLGSTVRILAPQGSNSFAVTQAVTGTVLANPGVDLSGVLPVFSGYTAPTVTAGGRPSALRLDGATLSLDRPIAADTVELHSRGGTAQTAAGTITANTLQGTAGYAPVLPAGSLPGYGAAGDTATVTLGNAANRIGTVAYYEATGDLALRTSADLAILGPVASWRQAFATQAVGGLTTSDGAGAVLLQSGGALTIGAAATQGQVVGATVDLRSPSRITEANGQIVAGRLTGQAGDAATLNAASNQVDSIGGFGVGTSLSLVDAAALTVAGPLSGASIGLTAAGMALPGSITGTESVTLASSRSILQDAGAGGIVTPTLSGSARDAAALDALANRVATLAGFTAGAGLTLTDAAALTVSGPVSAASVGLVAAGLVLPGSISGTGTVALTSSQDIQQGAGAAGITAATLTGSSAGATSLAAGTNLIPTLGAFSAGTSFGLVDAASLSVAGPLTAATSVAITAPGLLLPGRVTGGTVTLTSGQSIQQDPGAGGIVAANLSGSAAGGIALDAGANQVATLGNLAAGSSLSLVDGRALTIGGTVSALGDATLRTLNGDLVVDGRLAVSGLRLTAGSDLGIAGAVTATTADLVAGSNLQLGGTLSSGGSTGLTASNAVSLLPTGKVTAGDRVAIRAGAVASLAGTVTAGTAVSVDAAQSVTLAADIAAPRLAVGAANAPAVIRLAGGQLVAGGQVQRAGSSLAALPSIQDGAAPGVFLAGGSVVQTGTTTVLPYAGSTQATLRIDASGGITFQTLEASRANLILNLGAGTARGMIAVNALTILYSDQGGFGSGGTELSGTVRDQTGAALGGAEAASVSRAGQVRGGSTVALANRQYRLNGCAIASVNCVVFTAETVPVRNPLKEIDLSFFGPQDDDSDLLVPNITDQGL